MHVLATILDWLGDISSQFWDQLHTPLGVVQFVGALFILTGFTLVSKGKVKPTGYLYLGINLVGADMLAITSIFPHPQAGFLLLNVVYIIVAAHGLFNLVRKRNTKKQEFPREVY